MKKKNIKKRLIRKSFYKSQNDNMSEMIRRIADEFISMGSTIERRQSHLNLSCAAWNISLLPASNRDKAIEEYIDYNSKLNINWTKEDIEGTRHNINILIGDKYKYYPNINRKIISAEITIVDGKEHLTIASVNLDKIRNLTTG